jgi:hypothetical protein
VCHSVCAMVSNLAVKMASVEHIGRSSMSNRQESIISNLLLKLPRDICQGILSATMAVCTDTSSNDEPSTQSYSVQTFIILVNDQSSTHLLYLKYTDKAIHTSRQSGSAYTHSVLENHNPTRLHSGAAVGPDMPFGPTCDQGSPSLHTAFSNFGQSPYFLNGNAHHTFQRPSTTNCPLVH